MKKTISMFVLASVMLVSALQCAAADTVYRPDANGNYSFRYEDEKIVDGEAYAFIVVEGLDNEVLDLSDDNLEKILYIDETEALDGSVSFNNFTLKGRLPSEEGFTGGTAFIGGEGFNSATTVGTLQKAVVPVSGITLDKTEVAIEVGKTVTLAASVIPSSATDKTVTWTSSDSTVASVDANGVVKGEKKSATPVTITATASKFSAFCTVTVNASSTEEGTPGDVTGDGVLNVMDVVRICRKIVGHSVEVDDEIADVTGDDVVDVMDVVRICRKIVGDDVTLN